MCIIKVKKNSNPSFSSILVWLSDKDTTDSDFIQFSEEMNKKVFGYIFYNQQLADRIQSMINVDIYFDIMYNDFKSDFDDTINHLSSVVGDKVLFTMLNILKKFYDGMSN